MTPLDNQLPPRAWIPNAVTAASIGCGFASMLLAADGRFDAAVYLLVVSILLDTLDGRLARRLNATSSFGQQLDSLSDVLSLGAAPAFLVYRAVLQPLGAVGVGLSLAYLFAGVYRLARFNLSTDAHSKTFRTVGLPIPIGASYLMVAALMRDRIDPIWAGGVVLVMAGGMLSRMRLPNIKGVGLVSATLIVGMANYLTVVIQPNWYTIGWWNLWNAVILIVAKKEDRRVRVDAER